MFVHMNLMVLMVASGISKLWASNSRSNFGKRSLAGPQTVLQRLQTVPQRAAGAFFSERLKISA